MNLKSLKEKLDLLKNPKILVVGDFGIDEMIFGNTQRISREAPVLILEHYDTKIILGTASNAAHNASTLNCGKVSALGVYGNDYYGPILINALQDAKIDTRYMTLDEARKTTTKTRISGSCSQSITQQIVRIDRQTVTPIPRETENKVIKALREAIPTHDGIILSDYHLGFLTDRIIKEAIKLAKKHSKPIIADVQKDFERYKGVDAITPNQPDSEKFLGYFIKDEGTLKKAGEEIIKKLKLKYLLLTRGADGMVIFENKKPIKYEKIPAFNKKEVFDVTGAGDTVVSAFALALCAGLTPNEAAAIGNLAASIVIRHFGCHTTKIEDLKEELNNLEERL